MGEFRAAGANVVAVSSSSVEDHRGVKLAASIPLLSDPEGTAIRAYGLLPPGALPTDSRPVARPAEFLLDGRGVIRERFLTPNYRIRERPEHLLEAVKRIGG